MDDYKIIVEQEHSTVMAHYDIPKKGSEGYQSEAKLEAAFIKQLQSQGYEYVKVKDEAGLLVNMRHQLELLNDVSLSDAEWKRLLPMISNEQMTIQDKTEMIQGKGYVLALTMDNGLTKNIKLIDKHNVHNNRLQVINQYEVEDGSHKYVTAQLSNATSRPKTTRMTSRRHWVRRGFTARMKAWVRKGR